MVFFLLVRFLFSGGRKKKMNVKKKFNLEETKRDAEITQKNTIKKFNLKETKRTAKM